MMHTSSISHQLSAAAHWVLQGFLFLFRVFFPRALCIVDWNRRRRIHKRAYMDWTRPSLLSLHDLSNRVAHAKRSLGSFACKCKPYGIHWRFVRLWNFTRAFFSFSCCFFV